MNGAMRGLADSLDPDSAYLTPDEVKQVESSAPLPAGDVGLELTRQYYLRVIAARDNSPAAKAGLRTGDYVRAIDDKPTRELSVWEGMRALRGAPGIESEADDHPRQRRRPARRRARRARRAAVDDVTGRIAAPGVGYIRVAAIGAKTADQVKTQVAELAKARRGEAHRRRAPHVGRPLDDGLALARLFVAEGHARDAANRRAARARRSPPSPATAPSRCRPSVLIDTGTSGAAELFAAALDGNKRADLIGERTHRPRRRRRSSSSCRTAAASGCRRRAI